MGACSPRTARHTAWSRAARYSSRPGIRKAPSHCSRSQRLFGQLGILSGGGRRNRWLDPVRGAISLRLAEERGRRAGRTTPGGSTDRWRARIAIAAAACGVGRLAGNHADPSGDRQQRHVRVVVRRVDWRICAGLGRRPPASRAVRQNRPESVALPARFVGRVVRVTLGAMSASPADLGGRRPTQRHAAAALPERRPHGRRDRIEVVRASRDLAAATSSSNARTIGGPAISGSMVRMLNKVE